MVEPSLLLQGFSVMSGGAHGLAGYVYQQDYAAFRILGSEAKRLLTPSDLDDCVASFKVEGRQTPEGPAWDVAWTLEGGVVHLRECKDTAITREDRREFYLRARREIAEGTDPSSLQIGWVTDPGKQRGHILRYLAEMAGIASRAGDTRGDGLPDSVDSPERALAEAIYHLSQDKSAQQPAVAQDAARTLLARLTIDRFRAEELAASVEKTAPTIFESGTGATIRELIQGKLSATIQRDRFAGYTRQRFLEELGISQLTLDLAQPLRDILTFHSAATTAAHIAGITWSCRPDRPPKIWSLKERLDQRDVERSGVLVAKTGAGKTTSSLQMYAEQASRMNKHHVLRVEADNVDTDLVKLLPRLCCMLCGVSSSWLVIDGLDQIVRPMQQAWRQTLSRLLQLPNLTVVMTARREVVAADDWMQALLSTLPAIALDELSDEQVIAEFGDVGLPAPRNRALLDCLRNAYLFSLYAQTVTDDDMPLTDRGEVTAFDVIEAYWRRRVTAESQGFRVAGEPATSAVSKRAAADYLADQTLAGQIVFERPRDNITVANGIETLCREGVLIARSTATVVWWHSWLREFAAIERLLGKLENTNLTTVAQAVCDIPVDHAARNAAVGGCKWFVSHRDVGSVEDYLSALYDARTGLARDALTVLLEDSPRHLQLAKLPPKLLIEALSIAREMKARQWHDQVASLPDSLFAGLDGPGLNQAVLRYEGEMMNDE